jgi:hypothetical protein
MHCILAEDRSDAETLAVIVRRLLNDDRAPLLKKGFSGCAELCRKGAAHINQFRARGATRFIVCHDADRNNPAEIRQVVQRRIIAPANCAAASCIVVPVQELEAWIIADEQAVSRVIPTLALPEVAQPEQLDDPKEWIIRNSRVRNARPLYAYAAHNMRVAVYLDFDRIAQKCPSFRPLQAFVRA